eukprot:CAMPEP_0114679304 /NCGR_PEP_ID=MMETSP0191-20121206/52769_1 /TAXON_ID=126664 /ORGANISM="Sorites sp." /LENGTH=65 /DNA_ID=CAMNT_0001954503 /DNA_START=12 /DNA_END=206 /DNA_ORIENTATION=-
MVQGQLHLDMTHCHFWQHGPEQVQQKELCIFTAPQHGKSIHPKSTVAQRACAWRWALIVAQLQCQ